MQPVSVYLTAFGAWVLMVTCARLYSLIDDGDSGWPLLAAVVRFFAFFCTLGWLCYATFNLLVSHSR